MMLRLSSQTPAGAAYTSVITIGNNPRTQMPCGETDAQPGSSKRSEGLHCLHISLSFRITTCPFKTARRAPCVRNCFSRKLLIKCYIYLKILFYSLLLHVYDVHVLGVHTTHTRGGRVTTCGVDSRLLPLHTFARLRPAL